MCKCGIPFLPDSINFLIRTHKQKRGRNLLYPETNAFRDTTQRSRALFVQRAWEHILITDTLSAKGRPKKELLHVPSKTRCIIYHPLSVPGRPGKPLTTIRRPFFPFRCCWLFEAAIPMTARQTIGTVKW